ncbi:MAG: class I SAM-dependent methyltransferase [Desulfobulbus sp.]|jgi:SAM-dependent methyltransferase|uniref:class I SAM-dependent methyltransferase n=1 Tax=Desulfobulbus sp. TaxID=895 RepID=UPI002848DEB3|nr:class I SAM-dependent methyltransferase [Desulfobulbus sp.]MDR2550615.1 class I SAM-dependent methyltransferase [Desulfobulbus sp.]
MSLHRYQDIDWSRLWRQAQADRSWQPRGVADWDERAVSFARRTGQSAYADAFLALLKPEPDWSVLDVGSGPGTLALPLAARVRTVTCIDFSAKMLAILADRADRARLNNIAALPLSWDDDWRARGLHPHDLVIASRSLAVADLGAALRRLNEFAAHRVAVTDRVGAGPHDPDAFAAVGRPLRPGPDYIFTVNILYQMGCLATVDFIRLEETARYRSLEQALARYHWMLPGLDTRENTRLQAYLLSISKNHDDGSISLHPRHVPTWAYISWRTDWPQS